MRLDGAFAEVGYSGTEVSRANRGGFGGSVSIPVLTAFVVVYLNHTAFYVQFKKKVNCGFFFVASVYRRDQ